jgi:hypothetical protein
MVSTLIILLTTLLSQRGQREKFDLEFLKKLAYFQGNKKEDIDEKKKDVQVSGTPRATQTLVDIENFEQDVNVELSEFQDSSNCVVQEETILELSRIGRVVMLNHCNTH